jgi:hypothetical protein
MRYDIDLTKIKLDDYRELLKQSNLLPSRKLLLDDLDMRFAALQAQGIATVSSLLGALSSPAKISALAGKTGIPETYLAVLKREAGTLKPKRIPLRDFPDADSALIENLRKQNILTAKDYLESGRGTGGELYCLCDLTRINGVGPSAAKMFYEAGYRSPADIAAADAKAMLARIAANNSAHIYYQGTLGEKDMRFCIDSAQVLAAYSAAG